MNIVKTNIQMTPIALNDRRVTDTDGYPRKRARTRRLLITAGMAALAEHGPDGVTVADIAGRAKLAPGTFYNHFLSTQDLVEAICAELAGGVEIARDLLEQVENDPAARVALGTRQLLRMTVDDPLSARSFVSLLAGVPTFRERVRATVRDAIEAGIRSGRFVGRSPVLTTDATLGTVSQWMRSRLENEAGAETEREHLTMILALVGLPAEDIDPVVDRVAKYAERANIDS